MAGERFGPYRIDALLGRGAMGEVHRATDVRKERAVALKRLSTAHSGDDGFAARFRREAEMTARLNEPHVIPIHDYGEIDGQLYLDMRLVEGVDLGNEVSRSGPLDPLRAVAIVEQVAAALDAAHRAELIHRDVKPSNILLAAPEAGPLAAPGPEFAYLIDFGIAASLRDSRLTSQSTLIGTAAYMAPERFRPGVGGDHRVDVYALGCVLHEAVTGHRPFATGSIEQLMHAHLHGAPPRASTLRSGLPPGLDDVIAMALAKDPDHRYQRAGDLAAAARATVSGAGSGAGTGSGVGSGTVAATFPTGSATAPASRWTTPQPAGRPASPGPSGPSGRAGPGRPGTTPAPRVGPSGTSWGPTPPDPHGSTDDWAHPALGSTTHDAAPSVPRRRAWLLLTAIVFLVLLVLGGTAYLLARDYLPWGSTGAPSAAPAAGPAPAPAPGAAPTLPAGLVGAWTGTQTEPAAQRSFPVRIDLAAGAVGEKVGQMNFSTFDCRFDLYLTGVAATVDLRARPVAGQCSEGLLRTTVAGPNRFTYETLAGDRVVATGGLDRS